MSQALLFHKYNFKFKREKYLHQIGLHIIKDYYALLLGKNLIFIGESYQSISK